MKVFQQDFAELQAILLAQPYLAALATEHEKLFRTLSRSSENEERLLNKCKTLNACFQETLDQIHLDIQKDRSTDQQLQLAEQMLSNEEAKAAERRGDAVKSKTQIEDLETELEAGRTDSLKGLKDHARTTQERLVGLKSLQAELQDQCTATDTQIVGLRDRAHRMSEDLCRLRDEQEAKQALLAQKEAELSKLGSEAHTRKSRNRKLAAQVETQTQQLEQLERSLQTRRRLQEDAQKQEHDMERQITVARQNCTNASKQVERQTLRLQRLQASLSASSATNSTLATKVEKLHTITKDAHKRIGNLKVELEEVEASTRIIEARTDHSIVEVGLSATRETEHKRGTSELDKQAQGQRRMRAREQAQRLAQEREQSGLSKRIICGTLQMDRAAQMLQLLRTERSQVQRELVVVELTHKQLNQARALGEADLQRYTDALQRETKMLQEQADLAKAEVVCVEKTQVDIARADAFHRHEQNMYKEVRADRNLHHKKLLAASRSVEKQELRLTELNVGAAMLEDAILTHGQMATRSQVELDELTIGCQKLELSASQVRVAVREAQKEIAQHKQSEAQYTKQASAAEFALRALQRQGGDTAAARDDLRTQLVQRAAEVEAVRGDAKAREEEMQLCQRRYARVCSAINATEKELASIRRGVANLHARLDRSLLPLKQQECHLSRVLLEEQVKTAAMEEELQKRINIHPWTVVESQSVEMQRLMEKLDAMQRGCIAKHQRALAAKAQRTKLESTFHRMKSKLELQPSQEELQISDKFDECLKRKIQELAELKGQVREADRLTKEMEARNKGLQTEVHLLKL